MDFKRQATRISRDWSLTRNLQGVAPGNPYSQNDPKYNVFNSKYFGMQDPEGWAEWKNMQLNPDGPPEMPNRKWWQFLPFLNQSYEDQLANYQNDYNYWLLNNEREYNSPESQMDRFQAAGLNPNLVYSKGDPGNLVAGSKAEKPVDVIGNNPLVVLQAFADLRIKNAQAEQIETGVDLNNQRLKTEEWMTEVAYMKRMLSNEEWRDFIRDLAVKDLKVEDIPNLKDLNIREADYIARYSRNVAESEKARVQAEYEQLMLNWFRANQLQKWIPLLTAAFKFIPGFK